jgi:hypothetical protein
MFFVDKEIRDTAREVLSSCLLCRQRSCPAGENGPGGPVKMEKGKNPSRRPGKEDISTGSLTKSPKPLDMPYVFMYLLMLLRGMKVSW